MALPMTQEQRTRRAPVSFQQHVNPVQPMRQTNPVAQPPQPQQPPAPPQAPPQTPPIAGATTFGPGNDLRATQFNPTASPQLSQFRDMRGQAAQTLTQGPSRSEIATQRLQAFDTEAAPQVQQQLRAVGQRAAALGRLGMGQTSLEALQPMTDYMSRRQALATQLAADTAEGEIGDRMNTLNATRNLVGDEAAFGLSDRNELRGERQWQEGMARTAIEDAIRQRLLENQEMDTRFGQGLSLASLGLGGNTAGQLASMSNQVGQQASGGLGSAATLLGDFLARRKQQQGG